MNNKERFARIMRFQSVDRCLNAETGFWGEVFNEWPTFRGANVRCNDDAYALLGLDVIENFWGERIWANTFLHPYYESILLGETETTELRLNSHGVVIEKMKPAYGERSRMLYPSIKTNEDWKRVKQERLNVSDPGRIVDIQRHKATVAAYSESPLGLYCGSVVGLVAQMLTFEGMIYAIYDHAEMVEDMVDTCYRLIDRFLDGVLPHIRFDIATFYENITCKNGPTLPVWFVRDVVMPRYEKLIKKLNANGIDLVSVGSDGDVRPLLPLFMRAGANCLSPYEVNGCVHPAQLLAQHPGALRIIGGVDKLEIAKGKEAIDAYLRSLEKAVAHGGFIPEIDHDIPPTISERNFLYYLQRKREMFC